MHSLNPVLAGGCNEANSKSQQQFHPHQHVCLNIKASFITHKSSKSEHRFQMYQVLSNFLNLTAMGSVTATIQVQVPETHKAELKPAAASCTHIWSVWSRNFHLGTIILLSHLQILLQQQPGVGLYIPKRHNHPFTCFKVRINMHSETT